MYKFKRTHIFFRERNLKYTCVFSFYLVFVKGNLFCEMRREF